MKTQIDISAVSEFRVGEATFARIAVNPKTGVQAWRRNYIFQPSLDRIEMIIPVAGKYYPEQGKVMRSFPDDAKGRERMEHYLEHGLQGWFPGDEPENPLEEED